MSKTPRIFDIEKVVHGNKIKTDFIAAPFTEIVNEQGQSRQIPDLENNLKVSLGVERIHAYNVKEVKDEFGPNGNKIYCLQNRDPRIRLWTDSADIQNASSPNGSVIKLFVGGSDSSYIEVTFYGTGINLLMNEDGTAKDVRYTVDGGAESGNILSSGSNTLYGRSYSANQVVSVVSGLSLGIHTVRLRLAGSNQWEFSGVEIANEQNQLVVNPGQPFVGGHSAKLDAQALLDYSPAAITGTKGGRVIAYLDEDGVLGQAVTEVGSPLYLTSADHTNEEIVRRINWREFGKNRADDFSTLFTSASDRAFTLDDGTTTLVGDNVLAQDLEGNGDYGLRMNAQNHFYTLTFVGTGLDITAVQASAGDCDATIDGVNQGIITEATAAGDRRRMSICSNLPYGTHTVKINRTNFAASTVGVYDFIIYGPKKPVLPENVTELADYNVMADFVANTDTTLSVVYSGHISQGTIRKAGGARETFFSGGGWSPGNMVSQSNNVTGISPETSSSGDYAEFTFFGTGFDIYTIAHPTFSTSVAVTVDGNADLSAYTTVTRNVNITSTNPFTIDTSPVASHHRGAGFSLEGLPLGVHTVRYKNNNAQQIQWDAYDIITPIHINNTKVGSLALEDLREDNQIEGESGSKIDLGKAKAWAYIDGTVTASTILSSYNISAVLNSGVGLDRIYFKQPFKDDNYVMVNAVEKISSNENLSVVAVNVGGSWTKTGATIGLEVKDHNGNAQNRKFYVAFFGELEDEENIDLGDL